MNKVSLSNKSWNSSKSLVNEKWNVTLHSGAEINNCIVKGHLSVDKMSCLNRVVVSGNNGVGCFSYLADASIGRYTTIASRVSCGAFNHPIDWLSVSEFQYRNMDQIYEANSWVNTNAPERKTTFIGNDVWICDNSVILTGRNIGTGSIIGANSVVTKDVPPYAVACGNPAKIIKYRFGESTIKKLLESKWWLRSIQDLSSLKLKYDDVEDSLARIEQQFGDFSAK